MKKQYAETYGNFQQWHWLFGGRARILGSVLQRELRSRTPARGGHGLRIASLGSGPPLDGLSWLSPFLGAPDRVAALDLDSSAILREEAGRSSPVGFWFVVGEVECPPFRASYFDVVLILDVLEHLDDDAAGLAAAHRSLRPGGLLLVTVAACPSLWGGQDLVNEHRRRYTRRSLNVSFSRAGLPPPRTSYFNLILLPAIAMVRWGRLLRGRGNQPRNDLEINRPGALNALLYNVFSAERHLVGRVALSVGASLLALGRAT